MKYRMMRIGLWIQLIWCNVTGDTVGACITSTWLTLTKVDKNVKPYRWM